MLLTGLAKREVTKCDATLVYKSNSSIPKPHLNNMKASNYIFHTFSVSLEIAWQICVESYQYFNKLLKCLKLVMITRPDHNCCKPTGGHFSHLLILLRLENFHRILTREKTLFLLVNLEQLITIFLLSTKKGESSVGITNISQMSWDWEKYN